MALYELVLREGHEEKVVETDERVGVGDALVIGAEVWLVLRKADERAALRNRARYECRRALALTDRASELMAHAKQLELKVIEAREALDGRNRAAGRDARRIESRAAEV